jgi:hypothetical protein
MSITFFEKVVTIKHFISKMESEFNSEAQMQKDKYMNLRATEEMKSPFVDLTQVSTKFRSLIQEISRLENQLQDFASWERHSLTNNKK